MNTMKMITAMCTMGTTENMGIFPTPYDDDVIDFTKTFFSGVGEKLKIKGKIKADTNYLYVYYETLCNYTADVVIDVCEENNSKICTVFLYEIED